MSLNQWLMLLTILVSWTGAYFGGKWSGVRAAEVKIKAEQERQELLLKQSLHKGVLEALVLVYSEGSGAMFLLEAEKGFIHGTDSVVEALADSRIKLFDFLKAKGNADNAEEAERDWENARVKLLHTLRKGLRSDTELDENWLKKNWPALGADLAEVEKVLSLR